MNFFKNSFEDILKNKKEDEILEKDYFKNISYRKIRKELMFDVARARVEEILNIVFIKNINLNLSKKSTQKITIFIEDKNNKNIFRDYLNYSAIKKNMNLKIDLNDKLTFDNRMTNALILSKYGWKKEALPTTQTKNSIITKIFKYFFN